MFCQVCGTHQADDVDHCGKCGHKLLVLSGMPSLVEETIDSGEESFSLEEHLLERVSILEEVLKRTGETVRNILGALHKQEENILINHAGLVALRDLLEQKAIIGRDEWSQLWESKMDYQLLCLEKRERFGSIKDKITGLFQGAKRKLFHQYLEEAEYALYAFDLDKAIVGLEAAFKLDKENYELAHFLGETWFNQGQTERALGYYQKVLEAKPDHYEGLVYSGVIHHQLGNNERAKLLLERTTQLYRDNFLPHFSLGAVLASEGQLAKAVVYLSRAVEIDAVPDAHYLLGSCYYEMGKLGPASEALAEAVKLDPAYEECYHLLGLTYLDRRWNQKALNAFRQAQQLNPKKMHYEHLVSYLSGQSGELPALSEEAQVHVTAAEKALHAGAQKKALACYQRALAIEPENPAVLMATSLACLHHDRNHESKAIAEKVIELDPGEMLRATAYATLVEILRTEGQYREGNRIGRLLLEESTTDFSRTIAYYELAYNLAELEEDLDEALDLARRSLDSSPEELRQFPLAVLGWVHYKRGELEEAIDFLERSTGLAESSTTLTHLGMALLAQGDDERAREALDRAHRLSDRGGALEERMMEVMRDSAKVLERVRRRA